MAGRCIGRVDVPVDPRKAKRLAHRVRAVARRSERRDRVVFTSPLARCAAVGRWLARWGWKHRIDPRLAELDFGRWDGLPWHAIGAAAVTAWTDDFGRHPPGGGEAVDALLRRCADVLADPALGPDTCVVGHAGWISAALWLQTSPDALPTAATWPAAIGYGRRLTLPPTR